MNDKLNKKIILLLEDGSSYEGLSFGAEIESAGEVVFNTSMMGYPESLTDPSYRGQILTCTYPLIGNYGIPSEEKDADGIKKYLESNQIQIKGLIVSEYSQKHNHWQALQSLGAWLKKHNIPGLTGIDTRALTQKLREKGTMLGKLILREPQKNETFYDPNTENLVAQVSIEKPIIYKRGPKTVALLDCGMKYNILRSFLKRNITVIRIPWDYNPFTNNLKFDGLFISNGPGDPALVTQTKNIIKQSLEKKIPTFGICLGLQVLGIAAGAKTYKLKYGHRSQNQPCVDIETGRCYITSQNHGFAIDPKSLPTGWKIWFKNANDGTVEGIKHTKLPFKAVQFHPEATPGPVDTNYLFDEFVKEL